MEDIFDQLLVDNDIGNDKNLDAEDNEIKEEGADDGTEPKKRIIKTQRRTINKRTTLDVTRLTGPRGIGILEKMAADLSFKGKGHEEEDLAKIMSFIHYWTHRLYPKMTLEDCLEKIESLGKKRPTQSFLTKLRLGMMDEETPKTNDETTAEVVVLDETGKPRISKEQRQRILKNRMLAQARRAAKLQSSSRPIDSDANQIRSHNLDS